MGKNIFQGDGASNVKEQRYDILPAVGETFLSLTAECVDRTAHNYQYPGTGWEKIIHRLPHTKEILI